MPTIADFEYGYDNSGIDEYLQSIKADYLDKAKEAVENISSIKTCCENEWEGQARDNFVTNLDKDSKHVGEQFMALYDVLRSEISSLGAAMANKDETLIQID